MIQRPGALCVYSCLPSGRDSLLELELELERRRRRKKKRSLSRRLHIYSVTLRKMNNVGHTMEEYVTNMTFLGQANAAAGLSNVGAGS